MYILRTTKHKVPVQFAETLEEAREKLLERCARYNIDPDSSTFEIVSPDGNIQEVSQDAEDIRQENILDGDNEISETISSSTSGQVPGAFEYRTKWSSDSAD